MPCFCTNVTKRQKSILFHLMSRHFYTKDLNEVFMFLITSEGEG